MATRTSSKIGSLTKNGQEVPDPKPFAMPLGFKKPESTEDIVRRMIAQNLSQQVANNETETFEEADDFDVEDDEFIDPVSPYEEQLNVPPIAEPELGPKPQDIPPAPPQAPPVPVVAEVPPVPAPEG